ncbi:MaoC/PaaZ C-terminal domain-containing protein [Chloroflexota bacterium]
MEITYYEDIELHKKSILGEYYVDKEEMMEFAKKWDAKPFHVDEELAKSYPNGGLFAPLTYTLSVISQLSSISDRYLVAHIAALELERVQVLTPVRPGDQLVITEEYTEKRESRTHPDRGLIRIRCEVKNQNDEICLRASSLVMVAKRPA